MTGQPSICPAGPGPRPSDGDRGAALVEFALLVPVLAALLLGIITGGNALATKNSMTNAVREAARLGATLPDDPDWDTWAVRVRDRAVELSGGDLVASQVCVQVVQVAAGPPVTETVLGAFPTTASGGCTLAMTAPATPASSEGTCVVKVWGERDAELQAFFFTKTLTMESKAVGRYERDDCP